MLLRHEALGFAGSLLGRAPGGRGVPVPSSTLVLCPERPRLHSEGGLLSWKRLCETRRLENGERFLRGHYQVDRCIVCRDSISVKAALSLRAAVLDRPLDVRAEHGGSLQGPVGLSQQFPP